VKDRVESLSRRRADTSGDPSPGMTRRGFLGAGAATGLFLGLGLNGRVTRVLAAEEAAQFNAFLAITPDGAIRVTVPTTELGQGVYSTLPKILAEELDASWDDVEALNPHADAGLVADATGRQRTAASESVKVYFPQLRDVGASARAMLVAAAAARWGVSAAECSTKDSAVSHAASGRRAGYGELALEAAALPVPEQLTYKDPSNYTLIGRRVPRKDVLSKVNGEAVFGIDVVQPDMLHAALRMPAQLGGSVARFDPASVSGQRGVKAVLEVDGGVAVVADSFWRAKKAAEGLDVEFDTGDTEGLSTPQMRKALLQALEEGVSPRPFPDIDTQAASPSMRPLDRSVTEQALAEAERVLELDYEVPYLAHLTMEPMVCTALVTDDACHVWAPTQHADGGHQLIAELTGLPLEQVRLDITFAGGGFGRKFELDFLRQTVQVAKEMKGRPIKLTWTREQDVQHDFYRPAFAVRTRVALGKDGITGMHSRIAGQSIWRFQGKPQIPNAADPTAAALLISDIYDFPGKYIDFVEMPWRLPVGLWRSVTLSQNSFFAESELDEAAVALVRDPYALRRELMARHPRIIAVLDAAARAADWERKRPTGQGVGIAVCQGFGSLCAQVAEVTVSGNDVHIDKLVCVMDCGLQIDPMTVRAQLEGGMIFGLSAALRGEITLSDGAVNESNFHNQPILRFHETPEMVVELIDSDAAPGGVGEAGVPAVAPALANAIHAAGGPRLRRLPFSASGIKLV
jgi:isoquinoline 1-oxidoreductase beta subunit